MAPDKIQSAGKHLCVERTLSEEQCENPPTHTPHTPHTPHTNTHRQILKEQSGIWGNFGMCLSKVVPGSWSGPLKEYFTIFEDNSVYPLADCSCNFP